MYGDPTTTPGGKAIPFHSSVRIKLGAGQQIQDKNKNVIGIHVSAKTIKNKVAAPFRDCKFEIHFGRGIKEHEQIFDVLRKHGRESIDGNEVTVSGTGAWKSLTVSDIKTGEIVVEKKFHKSDFDSVLNDPNYTSYIDALLEKAMVRKMSNPEDINIDTESYEEVRAIALDLESDISPEE
jgi:hypothetical protein